MLRGSDSIRITAHMYVYIYMYIYGCFQKKGYPQSSILIGFSIINHPFWGIPIFGNTHILLIGMMEYITIIIIKYCMVSITYPNPYKSNIQVVQDLNPLFFCPKKKTPTNSSPVGHSHGRPLARSVARALRRSDLKVGGATAGVRSPHFPNGASKKNGKSFRTCLILLRVVA